MTVLTASTQDFSQLTDIQKQSCILNGISPERHIVVPIPEDYPRPSSWFKIRALIDHLRNHKSVLWMDADSMMLRKIPNLDLSLGYNIVELAKDANGWNCGVMLWRNTPEAFEWLWRIYDSYDAFRHHPWFEQAAFHTMAEAIKPKQLGKEWNVYEDDNLSIPGFILHLPAKSFEDRLAIMTRELLKLQSQP